MSSSVMFDRSTQMTSHGMRMPTSISSGDAVPTCTIKIEKCNGGMKITCVCEDELALVRMQDQCKALCQKLCTCCCTMNGLTIFQCNLAMCQCNCEETADGVCITCVCGDESCCDMIEACCDCLCCCMEAGCTCSICFDGTPCCCGTCC